MFMDKISDIVTPLYTQALNGIRVKKHTVSYIFDEVGCGKTVSAIIAIASVIEENEKQNEENANYKILVITPKSVCNQFEAEINEKLKIDKEKVINIAFEINKDLDNLIKKIKQENQVIVVANPHKVHKLTGDGFQWDFVIIDEAHDIVCNSQTQTEIYSDYRKYNRSKREYEKRSKIDEKYRDFLKSFEAERSSIDSAMEEHFQLLIE